MIIDCHAHHVAAPFNTNYLNWIKETGRQDFGPSYLWNDPAFEDEAIRYEKASTAGISRSLITYSANIVPIIDANTKESGNPAETVRLLNDSTINICSHSDGKLMATALIDLRLGKDALPEMERCAKDVQGYSVLAAYKLDGQIHFLDDICFEPFWAEAEKIGKPVFIHFSNLYKINNPLAPLPGFMNDTLLYAGMGQLVEDALCAARIVLSGVLDRHPGVKVVMGQLGGLYPFMLERMEMLYNMYKNGAVHAGKIVNDISLPENFLCNMKDYTDNIYIDTHSMSAASVLCAAQTLGEDKILFGSDYPITPAGWGMEHAKAQLDMLPHSLKQKVFHDNAAKLLHLL